MKSKIILELFYELLWFSFAAVLSFLLVLPVKEVISTAFFQYLIAALFLVFTYFRFIAFMMRSVILDSIWVKLAFFVLNIPLFFLAMDQYYLYGKVYDEYNYTLPANQFQHVNSGTELDDLMYIKKLVTFSGFAALIMIILFEIRIVHAIFKLRQLDKYLWKGRTNK